MSWRTKGIVREVINRFTDCEYRLAVLWFRVTFSAMNSTFTAIVKQDGDWWVGWIEEVPGVNGQERTKDKLLASLKEILSEALEFNRQEAREAAQGEFTEEPVMV